MSASTEKKLRQAAREAGTDKKLLAQQKLEQEQAKSKRRWTIGTVAVAVLVALILLLSSPLTARLTAYRIGARSFSAAEASYYYASQYNSFVNQYGSYAALFGLDTSTGLSGLDRQDCAFAEGSWRDYFMDQAKDEMNQIAVLLDYAAENGIALTDAEIAQVDASFEGLEETARAYGFSSANRFIAANYGRGVTVATVRQAYLDSALAGKAMTAYINACEFTEDELEEQYQSYAGMRDSFAYAYAAVEAHDHDDPQAEATPELRDAALQTAASVQQAYNAASGTDYAARLESAAAAAGLSVSSQSGVAGSSLPFAREWLMDAARQAGDITVEAPEDEDHIYVVVFLGRDDNHYATVNVRHILLEAEASEDGSWSDEALADARARAEAVLAEYESGDKTEESFAALAERESEDAGSNRNGGLYENVYRGQMVEELDAFCFGERKPGDTAIVYGSNGAYAGYHVMYYVGEGELYAHSLARSDLGSSAATEWISAQVETLSSGESFGMKFVG